MGLSSLSSPLLASTIAGALQPQKTLFVTSDAFVPKTFSYDSCQATLILPFQPYNGAPATLHLRGLNLVSLNTHRDKYIVTKLGVTGPAAFLYGHRTTAGSFGFTVLGGNPFSEAINQYATYIAGNNLQGNGLRIEMVNVDQLPPMDMHIDFTDSRGKVDTIKIFGITILDQAHNVSVEGINLTSMYSWMAMGCTSLTSSSQKTTGVQQTVQIPMVQNISNQLYGPPNPNASPPKYGSQ